MSGILLAVIMLVWLWGGYFIYGKIIEKKLIDPVDSKDTPAVEFNDDVDFMPAKPFLLFGHHFSSIAGAGPIVGPIIAVMYFGWLAASLWVALGAVFMGAVHDYTALMVSVRNKGNSLADVAEEVMSPRAKLIFAIFIWVALVLVVAVFGVVTAKTFIGKPEIVIPTFGLIFIAVFFGWLVYRKGFSIVTGTIISMVLIGLFLLLGDKMPIDLGKTVSVGFSMSTFTFWFIILMIYALFASVLPVWLLLQPRDYLSMWILFIGLGLGYIGLIFANPTINAPAFTSFNSVGGYMWPMLFVIIACGSISGFHSLVAGGTTSKQLAKEKDGRKIGYGAMIMEATLATLVIIIGAAALKWDTTGKVNSIGYQFLMTKAAGAGPIKAFAVGFGQLIKEIPGLNSKVGIYIGMLMLNGFVITSLDTATRLARFILQELTRDNVPILANKWIATIITIFVASYLGASGSWKIIWPVFGASNQLVAALALTVVSAYFIGIKKPSKYTSIPAVLMLVTTIGALIYQIYKFSLITPNIPLAITASVLLILAFFILVEAKIVFLSLIRKV